MTDHGRAAPPAAALSITVTDADLADLRERLHRTRWPTPWPDHAGTSGPDPADLRRLVARWADGFDWRAVEAGLAALPWHRQEIDGTPVGYLRYDGEQADALPLVLSHGWPSTVLELTDLAQRLATPSRYGRPADEAFTVIVPALPGFPGSPQRPQLPAAAPTHELWHRLLTEHLGATRYGAHGGDLGAGVTSRLGQAHPDAVVGIHLLAVADPHGVDPDTLTGPERDHLAQVARWYAEEGAYEHQQMTRPATVAQALADSPAGLLAWLLEKYRDWSDPTGIPFDDDLVLTQASLYWFSHAIGTSFRPYWEHHQALAAPLGRVEVPTAVAVFPHDLSRPPRSWVERTYDLRRYTPMPRGGHFAAHEEPALLAADITAFFRDLR